MLREMGFIFVILYITVVCVMSQFVFEDNTDVCNYYSQVKHEDVAFASNMWTVKLPEKGNIYYKLCGKFANNEPCVLGTTACLRNHETGQIVNLGTQFILDENENFVSVSGEPCSRHKNYSLVINLKCSEREKPEPIFNSISEDQCTYSLTVRDPKCSRSKCSMIIDGRLVDLSTLRRPFFVTTAERNFSITLCDNNQHCNQENVNACEIRKGDKVKTPISLLSSIYLHYYGARNQLSFHGSTIQPPNNRTYKRFELTLKCAWDKREIANEDLKYIEKKKQGKRYTFELETSLGCIKKNIPCVVNDQFLTYNLSGLRDDNHKPWSTNGSGGKGSSKFFLQVCGSAKFTEEALSCKSTYAQVCEKRQEEYINRGSVLRHLEVINDVVTATIENGMRCQDDTNRNYQTFVKFYCNKDEQGPKFESQGGCDTYFSWRTPHACPKFNVSNCYKIHQDYPSCQFQKGPNHYNLTMLNRTKSILYGSKLVLLNVCGYVNDPESPCMKDVSVAMKDLEEINLRHKVFSLGKFSKRSMEDGNLVLEYTTGSLCNGTDYTSKIRLECSNDEEEPIVAKHENCHYEFLWKTKYGCPIKKDVTTTEIIRDCIYSDNKRNKRIDFNKISHPTIQFNSADILYTFDICQKNYTTCSRPNKGCDTESITDSAVEILPNSSNLVFMLSKNCERVDDFNKVNFRFTCDEIQNNDHISPSKILNCTLITDYHTNLVCSFEKIDPVPSEPIKQIMYPVTTEVPNSTRQRSAETITECTIKSPVTFQNMSISNLSLDHEFFKSQCPRPIFNQTFRFVKLLYTSKDTCHPMGSKNLSYEVYLKCTSDNLVPSVNDVCLTHYEYEKIEICNLFSSPNQNLGSISKSTIGLSIGIPMLVIFLCAAGFIAMKKSVCRSKRPYRDFDADSLYERIT